MGDGVVRADLIAITRILQTLAPITTTGDARAAGLDRPLAEALNGGVATMTDIAGSNPSTLDPARSRSYFGGTSDANAARTVFRANPNRRAIVFTPNCSDKCNRRISAQCSTLITPSL